MYACFLVKCVVAINGLRKTKGTPSFLYFPPHAFLNINEGFIHLLLLVTFIIDGDAN